MNRTLPIVLAALLASCSSDVPAPLRVPAKYDWEVEGQFDLCNRQADAHWEDRKWKAPCQKLLADRMPDLVAALGRYRAAPTATTITGGCHVALRALRIDRRHEDEVRSLCCSEKPSWPGALTPVPHVLDALCERPIQAR